jgi:hypothetical protein
MGLLADIYRSDLGDCSNGGVSSKHTRVCVTNISGPHAPTEDAPAVELVVREFNRGKYVHAEPADLKGRCMDGGCFIYTCDSRFDAAVAKLSGNAYGHPVKLHDRTA